MTKEQILEYFKDINLMYNESTRYDDLSRMIDELEQEPFDEIINKTVKEIFAQCKLINPNYSKDWNEGFDDGMFHTITIIKGIRKAETE